MNRNLYIRENPDDARHPGWAATCRDVMRFLGIQGSRLPAEGLGASYVQGIWVWVEPQRPLAPGQRKRSAHRIMALCPVCGKTVPVGRLRQHSKVHA